LTEIITPLVTFAITCFNAEDTILRAIRSAQAQTLKNIEILVLDDGSSDKSVDIVKKIENQDSRLRLIQHKKNLGTGQARSRLVSEAKGEFIAFLDDDDEALEQRLEIQYNRIIDAENCHSTRLIACYCAREVNNPISPPEYMSAIGAEKKPPAGPIVALHILTGYKDVRYGFGPVGSCVLMARKEVFEQVGPFDSSFRRSQDTDWAIRLSLKDGLFIGCSDPLIRQHITKTPDKSIKKVLVYSLKLRKKHKTFLKKEKIYLYSIVFSITKIFYAKGYRFMYLTSLISLLILNWKFARNLMGKNQHFKLNKKKSNEYIKYK